MSKRYITGCCSETKDIVIAVLVGPVCTDPGHCSRTITLSEWHTMLSSPSLFDTVGLMESLSITADMITVIEGLSI